MIDLGAEASRREALHETHPSSRPLSDGYELVGLTGEDAFGRLAGLDLDLTTRPGGDGGRDFALPFTIDVKTARKAYNLLVEVGHVTASIYVLAQYVEVPERTALMIGWAFGSEVRRWPSRDFGSGVINHYARAEALRPMDPLLGLIRRLAL